ncbi:hypothetical protein ACSVDE_14825 [Pseudalkalibacillus sp. Hm43]|uniref:hypothetical protein n=1 Tax=Pseudalkalibacillus sp. Hm43 TaxID=3450742 RepID=UPI003F438089
MICPVCKHEQENGKFCGSCGASMIVTTTENEIAATSESVNVTTSTVSTPNENLDKAKNISRMYGNYVLALLKRPSLAFTLNEQQFVNGIITIILYALTFALSLYFLANSIFKAAMDGIGELFMETTPAASLPFFDITFKLLLIGVVFVAIGMVSTLLVAKLMGNKLPVKESLSQYSSVLVPFTALNMVAMILGLLGSVWGTIIIIVLSLLFVILFIPGFVVYEYSKDTKGTVDRFYWSFGAILGAMLFTYLVGKMFVWEAFSSLMELMERF